MADNLEAGVSQSILKRFLRDLLGDRIALEVLGLLGGENDEAARTALAVRAALAAPALAVQLQRFHTLDISKTGRIEPDFAYVGLDVAASKLPFSELFETEFAKRLGGREEGFRHLFARLQQVGCKRPFILETGCLRLPGNWQGDGQSTFMFDAYARSTDGTCLTVDINFESVASARRACSSYTSVILNDSVSFLHSLARFPFSRKVDLLYLDSFDVDPAAPISAAIHHIKELLAAWSIVGPGTIVCVDDFLIGDNGGKAGIIDDFFSNVAAEVLYSGYQKAWIVN